MSLIFSLYNNVIDNQYIKRFPVSKRSFQFNGREIIAATMKIILDNTDTSVFSPYVAGSLFFGADWNNQPVTIYDTELGIFIWKGRIKNVRESWKNNTVTVDTTNWVRDLADTNCTYTDTGSTTLSEHCLNILTDPDLLDLDDDSIAFNGFTHATNIQDAASVYCSVNYTKGKNKKCLTVIKELCRIGQMDIYTDKNNKVSLKQWEAYDGIHGTIINGDGLKSKTFESWYDEKNIYNDISIYYKDGAGILQYTDSNPASQAQYGKKIFAVPDSDPDTTATNNNILLAALPAATWCGDKASERYGDQKLKYKLSLTDKYNYLGLGDQIDFSFEPFTTEPVRIDKIEYDPNSENVNVEGEFLNIPHQYVVRDEEPPVKVELIDTLPGNNSVTLKWTQSFEADHIGYKIYFTPSPGVWDGEFCNLGISPIIVKSPNIDNDGYATVTIYELNNGTEYFFKVTSFDSSFNESADSNIESATPNDTIENFYYLSGNIYNGLTLDSENSKSGTQLPGYSVYDTDVYGTGEYAYSSHYDSIEYFDLDGFTFIKFKGSGDAGDINYQVRYSADGDTWEAWGTEADAIGSKSVPLDNSFPYFQIRFIFQSALWTDADTIYIQEII